MAKQKTTFSPYSIGLYVKCPRQYYFEYIDNYTSVYPNKQKIKQIPLEAGQRKELIFGELLHIVLNDFFHLPEYRRNEGELLSLLKETWMGANKGARGQKGGFPDIEEERRWYKEALEIISKFCATQNLLPKIAYLPEREREGEFVKANFLKVSLRPDVILAGKIDRIDKEGEEYYHLIDYKTSKRESEEDFQLMAYAILATEALGMAPSKVSYLYLRSGELRSFEPNEKAIERTKERTLMIAEQIQKEEEFAARPTKMCQYCDYLEFCPAKEEAKRLVAEYKGEDETAELPF